MITRKTHNYDYAPGIATYGLAGETGETGLNGNNLFYTNYDVTDDTDVQNLLYKLKNKQAPLKNSNDVIAREYQSGDYFFTTDGKIFRLDNYSSSESYQNVKFTLIGRILIENTVLSNITYNQGRLTLDSSNYKGFDIDLVGNSDSLINDDAAMNIVSAKADSDNRINFMQLTAVDIDNLSNGDFKIYYSVSDQAYFLESNKPIILNSSTIKVNDDTESVDYDNYSEIVTKSFPLTRFKQYCEDSSYSNASIYVSNAAWTAFYDASAGMFVKTYTQSGQQIKSLKDCTWDSTNKVIATDPSTNTIAMSLLYNVEVMLNKK